MPEQTPVQLEKQFDFQLTYLTLYQTKTGCFSCMNFLPGQTEPENANLNLTETILMFN